MEIPNPGISAMGHFMVESNLGLMRLITVAIHQEEHLAAIIGGVAILHHEGVGGLDVEVMRQVISMHQAVVPRNKTFLGRLYKDETIVITSNLLKTALDDGVLHGDVTA